MPRLNTAPAPKPPVSAPMPAYLNKISPPVVANKGRNNNPNQRSVPQPRPSSGGSTPKPTSGSISRRASGSSSVPGGGAPGGAGRTATPVAIPKPAPTPALPRFDQWAMKDAAYQQALSEYNLNIANSQTAHDQSVSQAGQDQTAQLGDWQTQYDRGNESLLNDFAARGLGNSGLFADAQQKYTSDAEAQKQSVIDAIMRRISGADQQTTDTKTTLEQQLAQAKQLAAQRGAGQYSGTV